VRSVTGRSLPYRYDPDATAAGLQQKYAGLEAGVETGDEVTIAGRLMLRRGQGKLAFGQLADSSGRIQLFAPADVTPRFEEFTKLSIGDWIGVHGEVMATRKGELSVKVLEWTVLAETRRPFPDKWHGITDPDTRYRQRYVDLWVTEESRNALRLRSNLISLTRRWLDDRSFIEVETPVFHPIPGGALARPFTTHHNALDTDLFLRVAPELYLKRLVVGGFERVFEIARVFRNEGLSPRHNPEFTMLELYQAYADWTDIMRLVEELVAYLATELTAGTTITYQDRELDLSVPWRRATLSELVEERIGRPVGIDTPVDELRALCDQHDVPWKDSYGAGKLLLELYEKTAEGAQWNPVFVTEYPIEVSPLARPHRELPGMTERFEAIVAGRELCNGFSELTDPDDQRARFEDQAREKELGDEEAMAVDEDYLRALDYGLPPTGGIGIGIDRLVMLLADASTIRDVVLFPTLRPEQDAGSAAAVEGDDATVTDAGADAAT
jgi:lysyl-tRNA synthetase class 2